MKKSNGELYSVFMLKKNDGDIQEMSVDVSDDKETDMAIHAIGENMSDIMRNVFALSRLAYKEKTGLKKGDTVDIIISDGKITFKDMGKDYQLIESESYIQKIKDLNNSYENVAMIGINYSGLERK